MSVGDKSGSKPDRQEEAQPTRVSCIQIQVQLHDRRPVDLRIDFKGQGQSVGEAEAMRDMSMEDPPEAVKASEFWV
ncbi:hypothetical protein FOXYSP1_03436 [Fusarium oxysporum f. sp. phaseoli]